MIVRRTYRYRLYPTRVQGDVMVGILDRCRELYNAALEERQQAYTRQGVSISRPVQSRQLPAIKEIRPEYKVLDAQMLQDVLERLDRAFQGFFRRVKAGDTPGYPRFKGRDRYDSFTFKQTGWSITDKRLVLRGIGPVKVRWSRPLEGTVKTVSIRRDADQWYVCFSCVVATPDPVVDLSLPAVGIDVGLEHFATLSSGEHIANPRFFRAGQAVLTRRGQALSRKKRGSARRKKARLLVAKAHRKVRNQRKDFHHKTARTLVDSHSLIAVEALHIANMIRKPKHRPATTEDGQVVYLPNGAAAKSGLNKSITDAGWRQFITILTQKAGDAAVVVIAVNPSGTSQVCSGCGALCPKTLSERWHHCEHCGCSLQRDHNAARNILSRVGKTLQALA